MHLAARVAIDVVGHDRLAVTVRSAIPVARGLGSSAALAVAAAAAAGSKDPLGVAARIDGHPENAAASVVGGLVAATLGSGAVRAVRMPLDVVWCSWPWCPTDRSRRTKARQALPLEVSRDDATFNLGRLSLLLAGLADRSLMIREATEDRLHQDYRSPLFPEAPQLLARMVRAGALAACWSGAGPTLLGICDAGRCSGDAVARPTPRKRSMDEIGGLRAGPLLFDPTIEGAHRRRVVLMARTFHIRTYGCQMNEHDSERLAGLLMADGLEPTEDIERADLVVFNTCCIRENADNKFYGHLGQFKALRESRPDMQIAVGGCLAQIDGDAIRKRAGHVDVVFGTHNLTRAPGCCARPPPSGPVVEILDGPPRAEGEDRSSRRHCPRCASSPTRPGSPSRWGATTRAPSASFPQVRGPEVSDPSTRSWPRSPA